MVLATKEGQHIKRGSILKLISTSLLLRPKYLTCEYIISIHFVVSFNQFPRLINFVNLRELILEVTDCLGLHHIVLPSLNLKCLTLYNANALFRTMCNKCFALVLERLTTHVEFLCLELKLDKSQTVAVLGNTPQLWSLRIFVHEDNRILFFPTEEALRGLSSGEQQEVKALNDQLNYLHLDLIE